MNKVIKFALAAGTLALVACSGEGSADADIQHLDYTPVKETKSADEDKAFCQVQEEDKIYVCFEIPESRKDLCDANEQTSVVSSCPEAPVAECTVADQTVFIYDSKVTCEDIEEKYEELDLDEEQDLDEESDDEDSAEEPISSKTPSCSVTSDETSVTQTATLLGYTNKTTWKIDGDNIVISYDPAPAEGENGFTYPASGLTVEDLKDQAEQSCKLMAEMY
ncbi:hypothetical protein [uncultured Fibrobacter sp.]|uniref:hypothetical protein n=1 Tax=uncultured Fibrobacter sp. TaxID=261512 RepID=UPI002608AA7F|nr:hypothetical protein [uncultured Fibrobacter sp.]